MPDLIASDVAVTQTSADENPLIGQRTSMVWPVITFGDGVKTYPANGIPLPSLINFRLKQYIKRLHITPIPGSYDYVWDQTNGTIRIYARSNGAEFSGAPAATSLSLEIWGA